MMNFMIKTEIYATDTENQLQMVKTLNHKLRMFLLPCRGDRYKQ